MNLNRRPISDMKIFFGMMLYRSKTNSMVAEDASFGSKVKGEFNYSTVEIGSVRSVKESEDKEGLEVSLLIVNKDGEPLEGLKPEEQVVTTVLKFKQDNVEFKANVWCDEEERVQSLCAQENRESEARLSEVIEKAKSKIDFIRELIEKGA